MRQIQVVIFDLDGTLYQDLTFYKRYIHYMLAGTELENQTESLIDETERILQDRHHCKLGEFYDPKNQLWIRHAFGKFSSAYDWLGQALNTDVFGSLYLARMEATEEHLYAGDAWSVTGIVANRQGIHEPKRQEAFRRVRGDMVSEEHGISVHSGVIEAIRNLAGIRKRVLITNTHEASGKELVSYLGLGNVFDEIVYGGNKPWGLASYVRDLSEKEGYAPYQLLSIGDHAWNDLYPVKKAGGRTLWISPYNSHDGTEWDLRLKSLDDLAEFLKKLQDQVENQSATT
jgi:FMN phosphatase YigB (HAD superfamily)